MNLFVPHAFYYSVAGERKGERPPDVGPDNIWWKHYRLFSDYMKRLSFLMTDAADGTRIAVLCDDNRVPYKETAVLYENQIEFRYLPAAMLEDAAVESGRVVVNGQYFDKVLNFLGQDYERRFAGKLGNLLLTIAADLDEQAGIPVKCRPADWFSRKVPDWTEEFRLIQERKNQKVYQLVKFIAESGSKEDIGINAADARDGAVKGMERFEVNGTEMVECYCNGVFASVSFWGKHAFEIGPFLTEGENEIRLVVTGNAANIYGGGPIAFGLGIKE